MVFPVFYIKTQREAVHVTFVTLMTLSNIVLAEKLGDEINNHKVNELQSATIANIEKLKDLELEAYMYPIVLKTWMELITFGKACIVKYFAELIGTL